MNVLVLRALGLGDLLTAVPALRALRDEYPRAHIALACPAWLHELVELWDLADAAVDAEPLEPLPWARARFDVAVNLHGRGPESTRLLIDVLPLRLIAFHSPAIPGTGDLPRWLPGEHELERWCRLLRESGIDADPSRLDLDAPGDPRPRAGYTVVHPGAGASARRWPERCWAEVARAESAEGVRVLVTGSPAERSLCLRVAALAGLPRGRVRTSPSLVQLAGLVARAGVVVCGDTGVAHLATALGTPSVVLFGPVSPEEWGPPRDRRDRHRVLWSGRRGDPHADEPDPGLLDLTPRSVLDEIESLRAQVATPRARARA